MKARSTIAPEKFKIGDIKGNQVEIAFFDDVKEIQEEETTLYEYSVYKIKTIFRNDLEQFVNDNYNDWLELAKTTDYEKVAQEVRLKRNELLASCDNKMALDRLGLTLPDNITATTLLKAVKDFFGGIKNVLTGDWAKYRQDLRDITKQEGFPYDVEFPEKPEE